MKVATVSPSSRVNSERPGPRHAWLRMAALDFVRLIVPFAEVCGLMWKGCLLHLASDRVFVDWYAQYKGQQKEMFSFESPFGDCKHRAFSCRTSFG